MQGSNQRHRRGDRSFQGHARAGSFDQRLSRRRSYRRDMRDAFGFEPATCRRGDRSYRRDMRDAGFEPSDLSPRRPLVYRRDGMRDAGFEPATCRRGDRSYRRWCAMQGSNLRLLACEKVNGPFGRFATVCDLVGLLRSTRGVSALLSGLFGTPLLILRGLKRTLLTQPGEPPGEPRVVTLSGAVCRGDCAESSDRRPGNSAHTATSQAGLTTRPLAFLQFARASAGRAIYTRIGLERADRRDMPGLAVKRGKGGFDATEIKVI